MSDSVLGRVALSYQLVWGPERDPVAVLLCLHPLSDSAPDGAHLLAAIREFWHKSAPQLLLQSNAPAMVCNLLDRAVLAPAWMVVDHDTLPRPDVEASVRAAASRGAPLVWRGPRSEPIAALQAPWYALQMVSLSMTQTLTALASAGQPREKILQGPARPPDVRGALCEGLASERLAGWCLDRGEAAGVVGWPHEEAAQQLTHAPMPPDQRVVLELLDAIDNDESIEALEVRLGGDPALAYRFLRYANSALLGLRSEIGSLRHGLMMVGAATLRGWLEEQLPHASDDPDLRPLRTESVVRARLVEQLVDAGAEHELRRELYLCGLFADLDQLMGAPHRRLFQHVPLASRVADAIIQMRGPYAPYLAVAKAMAGLDASRLARVCEEHDLPVEDANRALLMMLGGTVRENAMVHEADLLD